MSDKKNQAAISRIRTMLLSIKESEKNLSYLLDTFERNPNKYKPQLENIESEAIEMGTNIRVILRTVDELK